MQNINKYYFFSFKICYLMRDTICVQSVTSVSILEVTCHHFTILPNNSKSRIGQF